MTPEYLKQAADLLTDANLNELQKVKDAADRDVMSAMQQISMKALCEAFNSGVLVGLQEAVKLNKTMERK